MPIIPRSIGKKKSVRGSNLGEKLECFFSGWFIEGGGKFNGVIGSAKMHIREGEREKKTLIINTHGRVCNIRNKN